jgi:hypothetical protein
VIMRWLAMMLALVCLSAQAQVPMILMPTPLGSILTVYSYLSKEQKKIYYAKVTSHGTTFAEAKTNGFKLAVEKAIGPLILSEAESNNGRLTRDQIISYSAGMVDKFEITSQTQNSQGWTMVMEVWVTHSNIAARLMSDSATAGNINGAELGARVQTLLDERNTGDHVVENISRDYATRAYDIELKPARVDFDNRRNVQIIVPFTVDMNYSYAVALYESMNITAQAPVRCVNWEYVRNGARETRECQTQRSGQYHFAISMKPADRWQFWNGRVTFDDPKKLQVFARAVAAPLALSLTILDNAGQVVARACHDLAPYTGKIVTYYQHNNTLQIEQGRGVAGEIAFSFRQDHAQISRLGAQQARVMPLNQCRT